MKEEVGEASPYQQQLRVFRGDIETFRSAAGQKGFADDAFEFIGPAIPGAVIPVVDAVTGKITVRRTDNGVKNSYPIGSHSAFPLDAIYDLDQGYFGEPPEPSD